MESLSGISSKYLTIFLLCVGAHIRSHLTSEAHPADYQRILKRQGVASYQPRWVEHPVNSGNLSRIITLDYPAKSYQEHRDSALADTKECLVIRLPSPKKHLRLHQALHHRQVCPTIGLPSVWVFVSPGVCRLSSRIRKRNTHASWLSRAMVNSPHSSIVATPWSPPAPSDNGRLSV